MAQSIDEPPVGFDLDAARSYIATVRWQFAKTMPDWPHEYTVKDWRPDLEADFEAFCRQIRSEGFVEPWPPAPAQPIYHNHYLVIGEWKYWAMGNDGDRGPVGELTVINRAVHLSSHEQGFRPVHRFEHGPQEA